MNITIPHETTFFKALSEDIRLRIMVLLTEGELCVCDLTETLSLPQSSVSRHMSKLKSASLVQDRRDGKWVYYRIHDNVNVIIPTLSDMLSSFRNRPQFEADLQNLKIYKSNRNCSR